MGGQFAWRCKALAHRDQAFAHWKVDRGVDTDQIVLFQGVASDKFSNFSFLIVLPNLSKSEKVFLADGKGKLAQGIAEYARKIAVDLLECIDAVTVEIELGNQLLVGTDEVIPHRVKGLTGYFILGHEFL